ncbi:MAG TPA: ABC transporter ATP-binding protein, partial [Candidatus Deferrimicrobium sp.]|nr:ABC transporter ATP-binding protein [Candidatus Deferrimicrobium sp.]
MTEPIVSVKGISKKYSVGKTVVQPKKVKGFNRLMHPLRMFRGMGMPFLSSEEKDFWALRNITMDIHQGEKIGIIGRNGAGKSTLLKILSRLVYPTEGEAVIRGRVTSLLGVGTGFNGNMTGRENVYMDATLHGLTKREIDAKFDEIVEFSGVGKFIDTPVKFYSSGMYSRLAFSVSAHLDPDILMLDEVLAVGDMAFQQKC